MEFLDGRDLAERLEEVGRLPPARALAIAAQCASGLAAAHRVGVLHRDLKPPNIFITRDGHAKVLDLGTAKIIGGDLKRLRPSTDVGSVIGTFAFMSPEQLLGERVSTQSDIFALGVIGYYALSGHHPFESEDAFSPQVLAYRALLVPPRPIQDYRPDCPDAVATLLEQMLAKDPSARPSSMAEVAARARALRAPLMRAQGLAETSGLVHLTGAEPKREVALAPTAPARVPITQRRELDADHPSLPFRPALRDELDVVSAALPLVEVAPPPPAPAPIGPRGTLPMREQPEEIRARVATAAVGRGTLRSAPPPVAEPARPSAPPVAPAALAPAPATTTRAVTTSAASKWGKGFGTVPKWLQVAALLSTSAAVFSIGWRLTDAGAPPAAVEPEPAAPPIAAPAASSPERPPLPASSSAALPAQSAPTTRSSAPMSAPSSAGPSVAATSAAPARRPPPPPAPRRPLVSYPELD
jgi:hypothetical protein